MNQANAFMTRLRKFAIKGSISSRIRSRIRSRIYAALLALAMPVMGFGQNIYDGNHSREFAGYLMQTRQYQLANSEWERVLFFSPNDTLARLNLLRSYRLSENPAAAWQKLNSWYPSGSFSRSFSMEAIQLSLMLENYNAFSTVLNRSNELTSSEKSNFSLGARMLQGDWINEPSKKRVSSYELAATDPRLLDLYNKTLTMGRKSPAASVALSALVPGLGKIYSHDWKDGLLSLLFVATNAWQSYRGFSKNGVSSVTGWIFGTLAAGFYSANLFGSWKSATVYNNNQVDLIRHETEGILFNH